MAIESFWIGFEFADGSRVLGTMAFSLQAAREYADQKARHHPPSTAVAIVIAQGARRHELIVERRPLAHNSAEN